MQNVTKIVHSDHNTATHQQADHSTVSNVFLVRCRLIAYDNGVGFFSQYVTATTAIVELEPERHKSDVEVKAET